MHNIMMLMIDNLMPVINTLKPDIIINQSSILRQYLQIFSKTNQNDVYWCELDWWDWTTMSFLALLQIDFIFLLRGQKTGIKANYVNILPNPHTDQQCYSQSHYHPILFPIFQFLQYITACDNTTYLGLNNDFSNAHITRTKFFFSGDIRRGPSSRKWKCIHLY